MRMRRQRESVVAIFFVCNGPALTNDKSKSLTVLKKKQKNSLLFNPFKQKRLCICQSEPEMGGKKKNQTKFDPFK